MIVKTVFLSLKGILNNKMRSFLTMLGIIIGVMAVIILVSITQSATTGITESIAGLGSDKITASITDSEVTVTADSLEALNSYPAISAIAPVITANKSVSHRNESGNYSVVGITESYFECQDISLQRGRKIIGSDNEWTTFVAVIGTEVATDLFGTWDAVGGTITIEDRNYTVVGVLEEQGSSLVGSDDSKILIPYTTAQRVTGQKSVSSFYIKATGEQTVNMAINTVESFLLQATRDEDAFAVSNQSEVLETMDDVDNTMSLLLAGIAAISLLVGGIGIMNIMLVSVTERTREIGIRKAVGAKRWHICFQFLLESCILSLMGGCIGFGLSVVGLEIYNAVAGATSEIDITVSLLSIGFCGVIGILFGSYPAAKASKLMPIEALHN